jgi:epoxyqueuosine reductase
MTPKELTEAIKREAGLIGFDKCGITPAALLGEDGDRLAEWLRRGFHGTMAWMERQKDKRQDIRKVFPEIRSVLVVAVNYYADVAHTNSPGTGKISRYAWGADYHQVVTERLDRLLTVIRKLEPSAAGLTYVDTGPIMEKVWAERAGIGWRGKHTNVITTELGSWVFLGVLLLNLECEYDFPATDHCGTCTLCIEACPTVAIVEPYLLDASRCISYLTIEHRGEIPAALGERFDGWLFGCDICQDVCPWNERFAKPTGINEFFPIPATVAPRLDEAAGISHEEFAEKFTQSPVKRAKHAGYVRNAKILEQQRKDHSQ